MINEDAFLVDEFDGRGIKDSVDKVMNGKDILVHSIPATNIEQ